MFSSVSCSVVCGFPCKVKTFFPSPPFVWDLIISERILGNVWPVYLARLDFVARMQSQHFIEPCMWRGSDVTSTSYPNEPNKILNISRFQDWQRCSTPPPGFYQYSDFILMHTHFLDSIAVSVFVVILVESDKYWEKQDCLTFFLPIIWNRPSLWNI